MTYPLGWPVISQTLVQRERWPGGYKTRGINLVYPGQEVQPDQPVIRLEKPAPAGAFSGLPGFALPASSYSNRPAGDEALQGRPPTSSQRINEIVLAGMRGRVIDITRRGGVIIESRAALVQGAIGAGNQVAGILTVWNTGSHFQAPGTAPGNRPVGADPSRPMPPGAILVVPGPLNFALLRQAIGSGVAGIVASSISSRELEDFLHTDLIALVSSIDVELAQAHLPPITLLFTEGPGALAMPARTIDLLSRYQGSIALISGATSIRQSIFPELIISLPTGEVQQNWRPVQPDPTLIVGSQVRICSGNHEGAIGRISYLFTYQQTFPSGVRARAARLRLEDGSTPVVPLTLLERIG